MQVASSRELGSLISIGIHLGCRFSEFPLRGLHAPHEAELAHARGNLTWPIILYLTPYPSIAVDSLALQAGQADPYASTPALTIDLVLTYRQHA